MFVWLKLYRICFSGQSDKLMSRIWFINGAPLYLAKGWTREMEWILSRHYLRDNENPKLFKFGKIEEAGW